MRAVAGLRDVRFDDLRHWFANDGAGGAQPLPILDRRLGHSQPATTARHAHLAADPVRQAVEQVSGDIAAALAGKGGGTVVPLEARTARRR